MLSFGHALVSEMVWEGHPDVVKTAVKGEWRMLDTRCHPKFSPALMGCACNALKP
jgi:hypothetical protein